MGRLKLHHNFVKEGTPNGSRLRNLLLHIVCEWTQGVSSFVCTHIWNEEHSWHHVREAKSIQLTITVHQKSVPNSTPQYAPSMHVGASMMKILRSYWRLLIYRLVDISLIEFHLREPFKLSWSDVDYRTQLTDVYAKLQHFVKSRRQEIQPRKRNSLSFAPVS